MPGLPIRQSLRRLGPWPQTPFVGMPCLTAGHDPRLAGGTMAAPAVMAGEGAVVWTSTTRPHGPLQTVGHSQ